MPNRFHQQLDVSWFFACIYIFGICLVSLNHILFAGWIVALFIVFVGLYIDSGAFHVSGADHPGIVHKVTSLLAKHNMNIERLQTEEEIAPHGGTTLFVMEGVANALEALPKAFDPDVVRDELEELGDSLNCDITVQDKIDESIQVSFLGG